MRSLKGSQAVVIVFLGLLVAGTCVAKGAGFESKKKKGAMKLLVSGETSSQSEGTQASAAITSVSEAKNVIHDTAQRVKKLILDREKYRMEDARVSNDQLDLIYREGKDVKVHSCALNTVQADMGNQNTWTGGQYTDLGSSCDAQILFQFSDDASAFVNAIAFLQDDAAFQKALAYYQSQQVKPEIPEETRKYSVQAEFSMDQKQYDRASYLYEEGLKISPWWAQGRFNRALMLAQTKQYGPAITEMKRYLALEPESPNARGAQNSIYQWEEQARAPAQTEEGNTGLSDSEAVAMKKKMMMRHGK